MSVEWVHNRLSFAGEEPETALDNTVSRLTWSPAVAGEPLARLVVGGCETYLTLEDLQELNLVTGHMHNAGRAAVRRLET